MMSGFIKKIALNKKMPHRRWQFYPPTFNGCHNELKIKTLLVLYEVYLANRYGNHYLTAKQIHELSGVNYRSLLTRLPLYHNWKLICCIYRHYGFRRYCISERGRVYLERYQSIMPLARYIKEIETYQAEYQVTMEGECDE